VLTKVTKACINFYEAHAYIFSIQIQNSPTVRSVQPQEGHCEKRCEIQGGSQEMAVMAS